jgi:hypothetical protein
MADDDYYDALRDKFDEKRRFFREELTRAWVLKSTIPARRFISGRAFPKNFDDALKFNEMLMEKAGVAERRAARLPIRTIGTRICASASRAKIRFCEGALEKIKRLCGNLFLFGNANRRTGD